MESSARQQLAHRFDGSHIPEPEFAGDTGEQDAALADVLARRADGGAAYGDVLATLTGTRVLVPVVAVADEAAVDADGPAADGAHDKTSDMAAVLMEGRDGRMALLAFTGTTPMRAWDPGARPVPVTARVAALSAVQDGADALVLDIAGPTRFVVEGEDLRALAAGWRLVRVGAELAWIRHDSAGDR